MRRQRGNCYDRSNGILKNCYACSPVVKCDLFKAFCCNMYCSHLWCDFKNETLRRLIVGYNHSFRTIMKYPRHCSASGMFVFNDVPSFNKLWLKSIYGFKQRVDNSLIIIIIKCMCSRCRRDDIHVCFAYASPQRMPHMYDHKTVSLKYII